MIARLREKFNKEHVSVLMQKLEIKNRMAVPELEKININAGVGQAIAEPKVIDFVVSEISKITGQRPVVTKAKKAISNFKLRQGLPIGVTVTLRNNQMYEFMDRLFNVALPRVRDFKGVSANGFDKQGNYTMGLREHVIFPEVDLDKVETVFGMNVTFVIKAKKREHARELLKLMGMPFRVN